MAQQQPIRRRVPAAGYEIPDKLYFRIGEVARLCEVPAYVLRFWESEFPLLKPNKGGTGQRLYRRRDVEMALRIKSLLYDQGFTIPGARQIFKSELKQKEPLLPLALTDAGDGVDPKDLRKLRREMADLLAMLSRPAAQGTVKQVVQPIRRMRTVRLEGGMDRGAGGGPRVVAERLFDAAHPETEE
jgi:DNA-binding transcriptional MerR regulator